MPTSNSHNSRMQQWVELSEQLQSRLSHAFSFWSDAEGFAELRVKAREDGTILAIAKGFDAAGGPVVCFGSGFDVSSCLMALDASIQGNNWRIDKPWSESGG